MTSLAALRRPVVGRLGLAGLLSEAGDWMLLVALPLHVLALTGSALGTATVLVLELVPTVVLGPFAGVLVDRCDQWRLLTGACLAQAAGLAPLLLVDGAGDLWVVYVVVIVQSTLATVVEPARISIAAAVVPEDARMEVNGALALTAGLARLVGGPLGGVLLGIGGLPAIVAGDAASFLAAAVVLTVRRRPSPAAPLPAGLRPPAAPGAWLAGVRDLTASPALRRLTVVLVLGGLAQGAFVVLFVLFVVRDLQAGPADVGLLRGVQAIGTLAGALLLGRLMRQLSPRVVLAGSCTAFGLLSLVTWNGPLVTTALGVYVGPFIAVGVPGLAATSSQATLLQTHTAPLTRGRVVAAVLAVYGGAQAAGMLVAGLVGTGAALTAALQVQGCAYLLAGLVALRVPAAAVTTCGRPHVV
ncbi:MFS transporter [Modestobacter sp. I12A-02628]|uniref:MFS transporter n=1 Tax=Goekera deserti TaxID=2497753 RepID=A0A7K3WIK3_9ACTN|nr:MFS transporter [Goekera deserti]MPQ96676.1 MFS transporter [Goekera deserti]NDI47010.1 MFS transporter [Goekera deserti]NEL56247.1 MFS transporter [Goekera deserti]